MKTNVQSALERMFVKLRRKRVAKYIYDLNGGTVVRGPFTGLRLLDESNISCGPMALKIYGFYEEVVMDEITKSNGHHDVINIGAADGYFSIGLLKAKHAKRAICFEMAEKGRQAIVENAKQNDVSDQVVVHGVADDTLVQALKQSKFESKNALVICDIEGAEFDLFTKENIQFLHGAKFIIELHDKVNNMAHKFRKELIDKFPDSYTCKIIKTKPVEWSNIDCFEGLDDNDRALALSEGRKSIGEWLVAVPKTSELESA